MKLTELERKIAEIEQQIPLAKRGLQRLSLKGRLAELQRQRQKLLLRAEAKA